MTIPAPPKAERLTLMDDEYTVVVAVVLTSMMLAYIFLCCHVWGLHLRLLQLLKCGDSQRDRWVSGNIQCLDMVVIGRKRDSLQCIIHEKVGVRAV